MVALYRKSALRPLTHRAERTPAIKTQEKEGVERKIKLPLGQPLTTDKKHPPILRIFRHNPFFNKSLSELRQRRIEAALCQIPAVSGLSPAFKELLEIKSELLKRVPVEVSGNSINEISSAFTKRHQAWLSLHHEYFRAIYNERHPAKHLDENIFKRRITQWIQDEIKKGKRNLDVPLACELITLHLSYPYLKFTDGYTQGPLTLSGRHINLWHLTIEPRNCTPRGNILIVPGYTNRHSAYWKNTIYPLVQAGYRVRIFDLPGHGHSSCDENIYQGQPFPMPGHIHTYDTVLLSVQAVLFDFQQRYPGTKIHALAHSFGVIPLLDHLVSHPQDNGLSKIVIMAPPFKTIKRAHLQAAGKVQANIFNDSKGIPLSLFPLAIDRASDARIAEIYPFLREPAIAYSGAELLAGAEKLKDQINSATEFVNNPLMLVIADDDQSADPGEAMKWTSLAVGGFVPGRDDWHLLALRTGGHNVLDSNQAVYVMRSIIDQFDNSRTSATPSLSWQKPDLRQIPTSIDPKWKEALFNNLKNGNH